jgi:hypothetical protein
LAEPPLAWPLNVPVANTGTWLVSSRDLLSDESVQLQGLGSRQRHALVRQLVGDRSGFAEPLERQVPSHMVRDAACIRGGSSLTAVGDAAGERLLTVRDGQGSGRRMSGYREGERAAEAHLAIHARPPTMKFHEAASQRQAESRTLARAGVFAAHLLELVPRGGGRKVAWTGVRSDERRGSVWAGFEGAPLFASIDAGGACRTRWAERAGHQ